MFLIFTFDQEIRGFRTGAYRMRVACNDFETAVTVAERIVKVDGVLTEIRHDGIKVWDSEEDEDFVVLAADGDSEDDPTECDRFPDLQSAVAEADRLWQTEGKYTLVMRGDVMIWNCCDGWDR